MTAIDFAIPCHPDIHAMPEGVQAAGAAIRREVQYLYGQACEMYRSADGYQRAYQRSRRDAFQAVGDRKATEAEAVWADYEALFQAYHAWSNTAWSATPFRADPALLATVLDRAPR